MICRHCGQKFEGSTGDIESLCYNCKVNPTKENIIIKRLDKVIELLKNIEFHLRTKL